MSDNRISPDGGPVLTVTTATPATVSTSPEQAQAAAAAVIGGVSPTGRPIIPVSWVPAVGGITAVCMAIATIAGGFLAFAPLAPVAGPVAAVAGGLSGVGLLVLGLSPGLRAKV